MSCIYWGRWLLNKKHMADQKQVAGARGESRRQSRIYSYCHLPFFAKTTFPLSQFSVIVM